MSIVFDEDVCGFFTRIVVALFLLFRPNPMWLSASYIGTIYGAGWIICLLIVWRVFRFPSQLIVVRPSFRKSKPRQFE
jgi:hypothetical protein